MKKQFWRWWYENNYQDYLTSWRWKWRRHRVLKRDRSCVICGSRKCLQVHHRRYNNIFCERLSDLVTICSACHPFADRLRKR